MLRCEEVWVADGWDKKKKKLSTEETVLDAIIANHDADSDAARLAKSMIVLREASGTKSKYIDSLLIGEEKLCNLSRWVSSHQLQYLLRRDRPP